MDMYQRITLKGRIINSILLVTRIMGVRQFLFNLKDYNLRTTDTDEIIEEDDGGGIVSLFNLIEIEIYCFEYYTKNFKTTIVLDEYINKLKGRYILKKDGTKVTLDKFIPFIYENKDEYRMKGDSIFI